MLIMTRKHEDDTYLLVPPSNQWRLIQARTMRHGSASIKLGIVADEDVQVQRREVLERDPSILTAVGLEIPAELRRAA